MLRVYLDTNHWITLLKIKQGKETDSELQDVYDMIMELVESDKIRVLFSIFTLIEVQQRRNDEKRDEIIDFILDVSKLYGLRAYSTFSNREIENAIAYALRGRYDHDIYSKILGKGLEICECGPDNLTIEGKLTTPADFAIHKMMMRRWEILCYNPIFVRNHALKAPEMAAISQNSREDHAEMIDTLERQRREGSKMNNDVLYRHTRANHLSNLICSKRTVRFMLSRGIKLEQIFSTKEQAELFAKHLNSLNVKSLLIYERNISADKPITYNDWLDIEHLAGAVPYCDVVVSDKMAVDLCRRKKLDEMYDCRILRSLKELPACLPVV